MKVYFVAQDREDFLTTFNPHWKAFLIFFALFFTTQMSFRSSEFIPAGQMDMQVFIRVGVLGGLFLSFLPYYHPFLSLLRTIPVFFHVLFILYLSIVSILPSNFNFYSLYALGTHVLMFYVVTVFVYRYGLNNTLYYYVIGVFLFCLVSLVYYYFIPEVGRYIFRDETGTLYQSTRMRGIAGHPNTLGFMCAVAVLAFLHLVANRFPVHKLIYIAVAVIVICLILTNSRTSLGGMILMSGVYIALYMRGFIFLLIGVMVLAFFLFLSVELSWGILPDILSMLSRSGDAGEVTSLTGRSQIWNQMFVLIEKSPYIGWGHARITHVLAQHRNEIGFSVGQAHNLYLQMLFAGGIVGMFLYILSLLAALWPAVALSIKARAPFMLSVLLYIMLASITETIMISSVANNAYIVFVICLSALAIASKSDGNLSGRQKR